MLIGVRELGLVVFITARERRGWIQQKIGNISDI